MVSYGKTQYILLIDDDVEEYKLFCDTLEHYKIRTRCIYAKNCNDALELIKLIQFKCIFIDFNLEYENGLNCLREMNKKLSGINIPIYMYSGSSPDEEIKEICKEAGAAQWINKPSQFQGYKLIFDEVL